MKFVSDPPISVKVRKMNERVRWQEKSIVDRAIDQTKMILDDGVPDNPEFSFLVVGDSGTGNHRGHNPQRQVAELMLRERQSCRFALHTGDVVYLVGSSEYYLQNFIRPYREFLVGGDAPSRIAYDRMIFNFPFLPVPGNHDYYDLPIFYGILSATALPLRRLLGSKLDLDVGWHGSDRGNAYAKAFLDYLQAHKLPGELDRHLDTHYTAHSSTGRCLRYQPGSFTRLPNRYYSFRSGGIDFFALDSNTFNEPLPLPKTKEGEIHRQNLELDREKLEQEKLEMLEMSDRLNPEIPSEAEQLDDLRAKLEQVDEILMDIDKQLSPDKTASTDFEQLEWLKLGLIASWADSEVRGRVIYLHHPPYVTEGTKWNQAQTLAVRWRLREVFDAAARSIGDGLRRRAIVDLVLTGHAHCLEYLRTGDTGHADSHINWIICGGSGHSLRRQRAEGPVLQEFSSSPVYQLARSSVGEKASRPVAESLLYVGRSGEGSHKRRPYSCLRIDVLPGCPPKFRIQPLVAERFEGKWHDRAIEPFVI
ncbi:metallophosphoesterase [Tychonema sp. BBK16]|uniref:metallophosphoesterase family protein n=1 Tax=Tychonema sp. BBK16 TaxID=2699888 RepID=UPI001F2003A0|nr:metallophosphoesterase [Tychonema sp. BBK16]